MSVGSGHDDARMVQALQQIDRIANATQDCIDDDMSYGWLSAIRAICEHGITVLKELDHIDPPDRDVHAG